MDSAEQVAQRISGVALSDTILGLFLESSLGHTEKVLGAEGAEAVRAEVLGKRSLVSYFRYPVADLLRIVDLTTRAAHPEPDFGAAFELFGRAAATYFFKSPVGKTMNLLAGGNAQRLLSSAPSGYKAVTSFGARSYEKTSETSSRFRFEGDWLGPHWHVGVFHEALARVAKVEARTEILPENAANSSFVLKTSW